MDARPIEIFSYESVFGRRPFEEWRLTLDRGAQKRVLARIHRVERGLFGDARSVGGGVLELRIHAGPGYRIYLAKRGNTVVVLFGGGDKATQTSDIAAARARWEDYLCRQAI